MVNSSVIQVVFICDEGFALPTGVAMTSLLSTRNPSTAYAVHIVSSGLTSASRARLESLAGPNFSVDVREVDGAEFAAITSNNVHVSGTAIFKFRLPELFPELDRALYLDGDIVVRGDLTALWETELSDVYVAAVEDALARKFGGKTLSERIGYPYERYFNSGMMLVNLAAWRRDGMTAKLMDYRLHGRNDFMDQDALNSVLGSAVRFVDPRFNTLATSLRYEDDSVRAAGEAAAVIYHYASPEKPWKISDTDNVAPWQAAFAASPFADVALDLKPRSELDTYKRRSHALWNKLERVTRDREVVARQLESARTETREHKAKAEERLKSIIWLKGKGEELEKRLAASEETVAARQKDIVWLKEKGEAQEKRLVGLQEQLSGSERTAAERLKSIVWLKGKGEEQEKRISGLNEQLTASETVAAERLKSIVWLKKQQERLVLEKNALQKRIDDGILISVLIPVYNAERYLRETLASVMSQGLTNLEIVCVNDKSTDGSLAILKELAAKDPRLTVIDLPENGGVPASRSAALAAARGKYVYFMDSDDLLEPDILAQAFAAAEKGKCDVLQFGHREFKVDGEFIHTSLPNPKCVGADIRANPAILHLQTKYFWDKLFRHQFLIDNDIRIPPYRYAEDHFFLFTVDLKAKNFGILSEYGYRYRRSVTTALTRSYNESLLDCTKSYTEIVRRAKAAGLWKELAPSIWRNASECYRWRVLAFPNYDNAALKSRIVQDWFDFFQANFPRWQRNLHLAGIPCLLPPGQPKKVLLLGGTGALGAHLRDILAERGFEVWVTSRGDHADTAHIHYLQVNALDYNGFRKLLASHWDAIVDFMIYPPKTFEARLPVFLKQTDQYVSLSSSRVYADAGDTLITEDSPRLLDTVKDEAYLKTNEYALAKARDENLLRTLGTSGNWTIIRPYVTFSEERLQLGTLEKEHWLRRALMGKAIVFSRDVAEKMTTLTYGRDVALGMAAVIGRKEALGETFHITSPKTIRWSEALEIYVRVLTEVLGKRPRVVLTKTSDQLKTPGKYQVIYDRRLNRRFDNAKIGRFIDVNAFRDPKEALESCLRAFLASDRKFRPVNAQLDGLLDFSARCWLRRMASKLKRKVKSALGRK